MDFANEISAGMLGLTEQKYIETHEDILQNIEKVKELVENFRVESIDDYKKGLKIKGVLSSLSCYVFNNNKEDWERFFEIEGKMGSKLYSFVRKQRARGDLNSLCKYLLWNKSFISEDFDKIIEDLLKNNLLYKDDKGNYFVTGLHLAVGDNTFSMGRLSGKWHRNYVKTCAMQAFYVNRRWHQILEYKSIQCPLLDREIYEPTYIGDGKHMAKISFVEKDRNVIHSKYCTKGR